MGVRQAELSDSRILTAVAFVCSAAVLGATAVSTLVMAAGGSEALRWPFRFICHGQLDRAFEIAGLAMPLCARCCGIYGGVAVAAAAAFVWFPRTRSRALFWIGMALTIPLAIDGTAQTLGLWSTENLARGATGLAFGTGLVILAANGVAGRIAGSSDPSLSDDARLSDAPARCAGNSNLRRSSG